MVVNPHILNQHHLEQYAVNAGEIVVMDNHEHNFIASDIPAVSLCKCGVEVYYASGLQRYYVSIEGE